MAYTIYDSSILQTKRVLTSLSDILHKAEEHPNAANFPNSRLYEDMKSLSYQVFCATTQTLLVLARLTDAEPPVHDSSKDVLFSYAEMYQRIEKTLQALDAADKTYIIEHCEDVKPTSLGTTTMPLSGIVYANIMQANIFFHVTTAYGILRKEGVPLGKWDYLMPFVMQR
ncbi:hypothetical protein N7462_000822 [Penicillium macrosclerotiorum]|uniref:uncharacterized protein n=1 Tax=Penicillium macrosclerotiorum TaxID=303699 RepID=UPI0025493FE2|nr:uncharacterized protein N7462_000822 [Penicillium macrosclerotiorum]KAJ5698817.1 hypothetical protein N7462_000822 [Penicillium macrosclerotiorum]